MALDVLLKIVVFPFITYLFFIYRPFFKNNERRKVFLMSGGMDMN